jgi:hypothetical protein
MQELWKCEGIEGLLHWCRLRGRNALYTVLAVVTKRSVGQKQEEALRLLFSRVLALPLMHQVLISVPTFTDELT